MLRFHCSYFLSFSQQCGTRTNQLIETYDPELIWKKKMTCQNPLTKNTMAVEAGSAFPAVSYHPLCWSLCICWSLVSVRIFAEVWVVVVEPVGTLRLEGWENPADMKEGSDESLPVTAGFNLKIGKSSWAVLCYTKGKTKKNRWRHF